eukprot:2084410-Rhodomonas_salina.1
MCGADAPRWLSFAPSALVGRIVSDVQVTSTCLCLFLLKGVAFSSQGSGSKIGVLFSQMQILTSGCLSQSVFRHIPRER